MPWIAEHLDKRVLIHQPNANPFTTPYIEVERDDNDFDAVDAFVARLVETLNREDF